MSKQLDRLLRVRRLMEEISRAELAHRNAAQAALEAEAAKAELDARDAREQAHSALLTGNGESSVWRLHLEDGERNQQRAVGWRALALRAEDAALTARQAFLEDRKRRMQVEILLEERAATEAVEGGRREQQQVDDWFGMRRSASRWERTVQPVTPDNFQAKKPVRHEV